MTLKHSIIFIVFFTAIAACDTPPDEVIDGESTIEKDTETETVTEDSETQSERETDTANVGEGECFEAMMCIAMTPESTFECLVGLEEEDQKAATALAACLVKNCANATDDLLTIAACLFRSCPDETMECIGFSMF